MGKFQLVKSSNIVDTRSNHSHLQM